MGGSSSSSNSAGAVEAPNTLISNSRIKILDLIGEGTIAGFWPQTGVSGSNPLTAIYLDNVPIMNGDGSYNYNTSGQGFSFGYASGTSGQGVLPGYERVEALIPLPVNTRVTNPPPNNGYAKPVTAVFNTSMYPDAEAIKVTIRFPAIYTVDQKNGNTNAFDLTWAVDVSLNGGPFQPLGTHSLSDFAASPKCTAPYLNTQLYTLPKSTPAATFYEWKVRVRRVSQNVLAASTQNDMYVESMAVVSSNSYRYPMSALVGLEMAADQFGSIPSRVYDVKGIKVLVPEGYTPTSYYQTTFTQACILDSASKNVEVVAGTAAALNGIEPGTLVSGPGIPDGTVVTFVDRVGPVFYFSMSVEPTIDSANTTLTFQSYTYETVTAATYPSIWTGTWGARQWTDNPAWIFYDLCTNKRYGLGNYIRAEWVDKWTLYSIAQYCDELVDDGNGGLEPRFTCNVAIQSPQDAYTLLNNLVSVFRGMLYWSNGRIFPVGSETRDPVFNFTNANVIGGAFSYSDTPRNTRSTVCTVRWNDPDNFFRPTPERVEDPDSIARYGVIEKNVTAFATTSRGQAVRAANWILTVEQQLTETVQFQTDLEGLYLRPGDVINVYDNFRNNQQQGGRITDFSPTRDTIVLDRNVAIENGYTYYLSASVPAANYMATGLITGSNQVGLIRNPQIEVRKVTTAPTASTNTLTLNSGYTSNLYRGSVWIMSASGSSVSIFDRATQYKVLSVGEPSKGVTQVLAVENQTGINYEVNNNYSTVTNPPIAGDTTPPLPPTGVSGYRVTGLLNDNSFFSYVFVGWSGSVSANTAYYKVSGQLGANAPFDIGQSFVTGIQYTPDSPGTYTFSVAAFNANGYGSQFARQTYVEPNANPFVTAPLSGIVIEEDFDPYYLGVAPLNRYTGYVGTQPTFQWNIAEDITDPTLETASAQFISGYRVRLLKITDETTSLFTDPIIIPNKVTDIWTPPPGYLQNSGTSIKALRAFTLSVDTIDDYGNIRSGARLAVSNPQPRAPISSGFVGYNGGVSYNINPAATADLSGVFIWVNTSPSFTPTFNNVTYSSPNLAAFAPGPQEGSFYTWFALVDSYGPSGSIATQGDYNTPIYGPISGNANQIAGELFIDLSNEISGAFGLITGTFTNSINILSGQNQLTFQTVQGISGQITGLGSIGGAVNTALNVRVNTATVSASGALSTQIDAVSARVQLTGSTNFAQTATVASALATTGGALSQYTQSLQAYTSGANSRVTIAASAFVTGDVNGFGGVAVARWGFKLDANGKVVSMEATSSSFPNTYGTIAFGQANLQSNSYTAGTTGWQIRYDGSTEFNDLLARGTLQSYIYTPGSAGWRVRNNGDAEFNNVYARGVFSGGTSTAIAMLDGNGAIFGNPSAERVQMGSQGSNKGIVRIYNPDNNVAAQLYYADIGGAQYPGVLSLFSDGGTENVTLRGQGVSSLKAGVQFGAGSSPSTVTTVYNGNQNTVLAGGSPSEAFTIDLTNRGFSAAPTAGFLTSIDALYVVVYNSATSSSTTANCSIRSTDGSNIPATTTPISFLFIS